MRARSDEGFQLSSANNGANDRPTEEAERIKENNDVKVVLKSYKYCFTPRNVTTGHLVTSHNLRIKHAENININ